MDKSGENLLFFLIGGCVGASIALLVAPRSGKQTRELIASRTREGSEFVTSKGREAADMAGSATRNLQTHAEGLVDRSLEILNRQREQLSAAVEAGKQAYVEEKSKLRQDG